MSDEHPTVKQHLITAVATAVVVTGAYFLFDYLSGAVRQPPFRGTLIAEFRLVSVVVAMFVVLTIVHWIVGLVRKLMKV